jgi:hypothetical protein
MKGFSKNNAKLVFKKDEITFVVNEEKRTIKCVIKSHIAMPFNTKSPVQITNKDFITEGIAKCHKEDVFEEERGKRIALSKAENNAYKKAMKYLKEQKNYLEFFATIINEFIDKGERQCIHNEDYMLSVTEPTHKYFKEKITTFKRGKTLKE